jgi:protein-disulfide isomerase
VPVGPDDPVRGPVGALVTVVEFSDFECPFCKREAAIMKELLARYPDDVRLVWKDCPLPVHPNAEPAAELARAARASLGDDGFWRVHDALYESQSELGEALYKKIATNVGLPWERVSADMRKARFGEKIRAGAALADRVDVPATPTVFVNGRKLVGAQPYEKLRALVEEEREKAKKWSAPGGGSGQRGGPPPVSVRSPGANALYDALVAAGKQVEPPTDLPPP